MTSGIVLVALWGLIVTPFGMARSKTEVIRSLHVSSTPTETTIHISGSGAFQPQVIAVPGKSPLIRLLLGRGSFKPKSFPVVTEQIMRLDALICRRRSMTLALTTPNTLYWKLTSNGQKTVWNIQFTTKGQRPSATAARIGLVTSTRKRSGTASAVAAAKPTRVARVSTKKNPHSTTDKRNQIKSNSATKVGPGAPTNNNAGHNPSPSTIVTTSPLVLASVEVDEEPLVVTGTAVPAESESPASATATNVVEGGSQAVPVPTASVDTHVTVTAPTIVPTAIKKPAPRVAPKGSKPPLKMPKVVTKKTPAKAATTNAPTSIIVRSSQNVLAIIDIDDADEVGGGGSPSDHAATSTGELGAGLAVESSNSEHSRAPEPESTTTVSKPIVRSTGLTKPPATSNMTRSIKAPTSAWNSRSKSKASQSVSLVYSNTDISKIMKSLSLQSGFNIVAGPGVTGNVTVTLRRVTVESALDWLTRLTGLGYALVGSTYVVGNAKELVALTRIKTSANVITATEAFLYADGQNMVDALRVHYPGVLATLIRAGIPNGSRTPADSASVNNDALPARGGVIHLVGPEDDIAKVKQLIVLTDDILVRSIESNRSPRTDRSP